MPLSRGTTRKPAPVFESPDELLSKLSSRSVEERRHAAVALEEAEGVTTDDIMDALDTEQEPEVMSALALAARARPSDRLTYRLVEMLRRDDAGKRTIAIDILRETGHRDLPLIKDLLEDEDTDVRILAINILAEVRSRDIYQLLLGRLDDEPDVNVVAAVVDALLEIGDREAIAPLERVKLRFSDEPALAFAVDLVLRQLGTLEQR